MDWGNLTNAFEGAHRPGHFDGVVAVVDLLFEAVKPGFAVFGEKDLQQVAVVKRLARERHPGLEVVVGSLVRDANGLALSSRNARLDAEGLELALSLSRALKNVKQGWADERPMSEALSEARATLEATEGVTLEYLDAVNGTSFESHEEEGAAPTHVVVAAHVQGSASHRQRDVEDLSPTGVGDCVVFQNFVPNLHAMGAVGPTQLLLIALVILLLFGGRKIPELMRGLGQGMKEFKDASNGKDDKVDEGKDK